MLNVRTRTEGDALSEYIDVDADEWRQTRGEE